MSIQNRVSSASATTGTSILIATCLAFVQVPVYAETEQNALITQLQQQIFALTKRITVLEQSRSDKPKILADIPLAPAQSKLVSSQVTNTPTSTPSWSDRIRITGDLRSRYENIEDQRSSEDRNRHRLRARLLVEADLSARWSAGIGFASGGDSPISANQSLGDGGSTKDLGLDLAYINFALSESLSISSGKFKNPFYRVGNYHMVWDSDFRPEGFAFNYNNRNFWLKGMVHFLESDDASGLKDAETSYGLQTGISHTFSETVNVIAGLSYYQFNVRGSRPFSRFSPLGNTFASDGTYANNYQQLELFTEISTLLGELPVTGFMDYVNNLDISNQDTAWAVGLKLGKASAARSWEVAYRYQNLEADALYAALTDSDFAGGRTDNTGHIIQAAFAPYQNTKLSLKYFISAYGKHNTGVWADHDRLQLDMALKF